ncbi:MAG TPA: EamA family transporter [Terriglobia bacterium]|nr:EamA family transporter [Terriglobia bacterium]
MRTFLFLAIIVLSGTGGDIAVTHAMKRIGEVNNFAPRALLGVLRRFLQSRWAWLGIALMALAFFSLLALLSWADVSFVVPATAANYIVGGLGAKFLLKERVSKARWAGMLLVAAGVAMVCAAR